VENFKLKEVAWQLPYLKIKTSRDVPRDVFVYGDCHSYLLYVLIIAQKNSKI